MPKEGTSKRTMHWMKLKQAKGKYVSIASTEEMIMNHEGVQPVARAVQGVGK